MINLENLVEVKLPEPDDFKIVMETLSRIGVASERDNTLYQSCHILHKQGKYYLVHFKEMFLLDGKSSNFSEDDVARRNAIANLLSDWGLVELVDKKKSESPVAPLRTIRILSHKEKSRWNLVAKYTIGKKRGYNDNQ